MTASAPTPDEMERDDNHEPASLPAPTKNTSIMQVRFPPHAAPPAIPLQHNPHPDPSPPRPNPAAAARLSPSFVASLDPHLPSVSASVRASPAQVYRQAVEAERSEQLLEKHRKRYVAGNAKTDPSARLRERTFEYASLNEHLVMLSLTRAVRTPRSSHNPSHNY